MPWTYCTKAIFALGSYYEGHIALLSILSALKWNVRHGVVTVVQLWEEEG